MIHLAGIEILKRIREYRVLSFDCYGTLIDWETGIVKNLSRLIEQTDAKTTDEILETHAYFESEQQKMTPTMPYSRLLAVVYRRIAEKWLISVDWDECLAYGHSVGDWPAFDDAASSLQKLSRDFTLVILSNVDNASFKESQGKLAVDFDAIYTAEDVGSYKPSLRNFNYMVENIAHIGFKASEILHIAESLFHDHVPANQLRLANCWIHRRRGKQGYGATRVPDSQPKTDYVYGSMQEFVDACAAD